MNTGMLDPPRGHLVFNGNWLIIISTDVDHLSWHGSPGINFGERAKSPKHHLAYLESVYHYLITWIRAPGSHQQVLALLIVSYIVTHKGINKKHMFSQLIFILLLLLL